jgi:hypothetical protein
MKGHRPFLPYLLLSIFIPLIFPTFVWALGFATLGRVVLCLVGRRAKGPEGKSSWQELKVEMKPLRCFPRDSRESSKRLLCKKREPIR